MHDAHGKGLTLSVLLAYIHASMLQPDIFGGRRWWVASPMIKFH